jgi:hypothetical protein
MGSAARRALLPIVTVTALILGARALYLQAAYAFGAFGVRRHHLESWLALAAVVTIFRGALAGGFSTTAPRGPRTPWLALGGVGVFAVVLYASIIGLPLLSDDHVLLDWATHNQFAAAQEPFVRPAALVVWRAASWLPNVAPVMHGLNVVLHAVNGVLVVLLLDALGVSPGIACLGGIVFVAWPTQAEAVVWASGMFDVLMTTFVLSGCVIYARTEGRIGRSSGAAIACLAVAAVLTKETAVCLPALLLLLSLDRWLSRRLSRRELVVIGVMGAAMAAYLVWRLGFRRPVDVAPSLVLTRYALKEQISRSYGGLGVPLTSDVTRDHPWVTLAFMVVTFFIGNAAILIHRRGNRSIAPIVAGAVWIAVAAFPAMGLLFVGDYLEGSRYLYLPTAGFALVFSAACQALYDRSRVAGVLVVTATALLIPVCILQDRALTRDWRTAGDIQDVVLQRANEAARAANCRPIGLVAPPETYRGTQVLRNGAIEAFRERFPDHATADRRPCTLTWTGSVFLAQ